MDRPVDRNHVRFQFHDVPEAAIAIVKIGLTVVIDERIGIDRIGFYACTFGQQRFAQRIDKGAFRRFGRGHPDAAFGAEVEIIGAVPLDGIGCPGLNLAPL